MNTAVTLFNLILPYLAAGGAITVLTQILKRLVSLENSAVVRLLFHTITIAITALTYLLGDHGVSYYLLLLHASAYSGIANALFPFVSKIDKTLSQLRRAFQIINQDVNAAETVINEAAAATPPAADF